MRAAGGKPGPGERWAAWAPAARPPSPAAMHLPLSPAMPLSSDRLLRAALLLRRVPGPLHVVSVGASLSQGGSASRAASPGTRGPASRTLDERLGVGRGALRGSARQCPRRPLEGSERLSLPGPAGAWGEGSRPALWPQWAERGRRAGTPPCQDAGFGSGGRDEAEEGQLAPRGEELSVPLLELRGGPPFTPKAAETSQLCAAAGEPGPQLPAAVCSAPHLTGGAGASERVCGGGGSQQALHPVASALSELAGSWHTGPTLVFPGSI